MLMKTVVCLGGVVLALAVAEHVAGVDIHAVMIQAPVYWRGLTRIVYCMLTMLKPVLIWAMERYVHAWDDLSQQQFTFDGVYDDKPQEVTRFLWNLIICALPFVVVLRASAAPAPKK